MRNFRNWDIYTEGMKFVKEIYSVTGELPIHENFGLTSQIRRAAVSVVNNIAEGAAKTSSKDFCRFLEMSLGSAFETETLLKIMKDLSYADPTKIDELLVKIEIQEKRINAFIQKIKKEDR
ncbi:MAG: four helix bundle protein [Brumimicrobium sp.]|nr:four helix bundle protein [Brumimicrobium sp.]